MLVANKLSGGLGVKLQRSSHIKKVPHRDGFQSIGEEYDSSQISSNRKPVYWGGFFKQNFEPWDRELLLAPAYSLLPKLRVFGDSDQNPELIVIVGQVASQRRRTGKNVLASHFMAAYNALDKVSFPIIYFSTGDELLLKKGISYNTSEDEIQGWRDKWTYKVGYNARRSKDSIYRPFNLPNVKVLAPPYKSANVIAESDEIFTFRPSDLTPQLFMSFTMLKAANSEKPPAYMQIAREIVKEIREKDCTKTEALDFLEKWKDNHPDVFDKRGTYKIEGAINDVYKYLDSKAKTLEEMILERKNGRAFVYVINFKDMDVEADRYFAQHIAELLVKYNNLYANNMYPKSRYVPPVLIPDEAGTFIPDDSGDTSNSIVNYITQVGKFGAPVVVIAQYTHQLHRAIINTNNLVEGCWTHLFECEMGQAWYTCKIMKAKSTIFDGRRVSVDRLPSWYRYEYDKKPEFLKFKAMVKPPEVYKPT